MESDFEAKATDLPSPKLSQELAKKPDSPLSSNREPEIVYSPGLTSKGKFYTVVSSKRKDSSPLRDKKKEKLKALEEQMANQNQDEVSGSDALNVDHGYYNFQNTPMFHSSLFTATYARYKRKLTM